MSKNKSTSPVAPREADKFNLRFPEGMRDQIALEAKRNGRSMNTEIITRLAESLSSDADAARDVMISMLEREFAGIRHELTKTQEMIKSGQ